MLCPNLVLPSLAQRIQRHRQQTMHPRVERSLSGLEGDYVAGQGLRAFEHDVNASAVEHRVAAFVGSRREATS